MVIQLLLLFALGVYSIVDHYQTIALINLGYEEANPIVLFIIGQENNWDNLLTVKIATIALCGCLLIINNFYKKEKLK